jgi:hypothetical protein
MIMDMTWADLEKNHGAKDPEKSKKSLDKIRKWLSTGAGGGAV